MTKISLTQIRTQRTNFHITAFSIFLSIYIETTQQYIAVYRTYRIICAPGISKAIVCQIDWVNREGWIVCVVLYVKKDLCIHDQTCVINGFGELQQKILLP
jgi:hypothetical protein